MTQNEFNFIREACIAKINTMLDNIVEDAAEWRCPVCHSKYMLQCINGKLSFNE